MRRLPEPFRLRSVSRLAGKVTVGPDYDLSVFINCPFDDDYKRLLNAAMFTIQDCGFKVRIAVEDVGSTEYRLAKILRLIDESRYSIHDISRTETTAKSPNPRFNMPFECGLAVGAQRFGTTAKAKQKDALLMWSKPFDSKVTMSDMAGQDGGEHGEEVDRLIEVVRRFLAAKAKIVIAPTTAVRGAEKIFERFQAFESALPAIAKALDISANEIDQLSYIPDWLSAAARWQAANP